MEKKPAYFCQFTLAFHKNTPAFWRKTSFFRRNRQTLWGGRTDANPKLLLNDI